jgi:hypothetical protein
VFRNSLKMLSLPRTPSRLRRAAFLPIGTRVPPCALALGSRGCAVADGWGALALSIRPAQLSSLSQSNSSFDFTRLARPRTKHTDELLLLPTFQQTCPDKTKFSGSQVQRYSLRLVFLPHIRFTAKSAAAVGSSCQSRLCSAARLINQNRAALASAPLGSAPEMDSASLRSLPRQL